ncbi:hypothetical protein C8R42DRAFT_644922 [Lentinula raphanica]|nr:hypothetical protein C8R42DRAFT_644922 [Lentinula raphanica]
MDPAGPLTLLFFSLLKHLPSYLEASQALSCFSQGRFCDVIPRENDSLVIEFLDSRSASQFTRKFLSVPRAPPLKDASIEYGRPTALPAETLIAVELKNASRVIRVSSNNTKDIPETLINDVKKKAVHFMSIYAAMKASDLLRTSEAYAGYSVYHGYDKKCDTPTPYPSNSQTDLVVTVIRKGATTSELLRRIQSGLPNLNRDVMRSITFDEPNAKAFIDFLEPAVVKIVFHSFNNAKSSTAGVSVSTLRVPISGLAVSAGVLLVQYPCHNVDQLRRVLKVAKRFSTVVSHPYNSSKIKPVKIKFADIFSAFKALDCIGKDMDSYLDFAGTHISFATSTDKVKPMKIVCAKPTSKSESTQAQEAPVSFGYSQ